MSVTSCGRGIIMIVRDHLNIPNDQTNTDLFKVVHERVLSTRSVMASRE